MVALLTLKQGVQGSNPGAAPPKFGAHTPPYYPRLQVAKMRQGSLKGIGVRESRAPGMTKKPKKPSNLGKTRPISFRDPPPSRRRPQCPSSSPCWRWPWSCSATATSSGRRPTVRFYNFDFENILIKNIFLSLLRRHERGSPDEPPRDRRGGVLVNARILLPSKLSNSRTKCRIKLFVFAPPASAASSVRLPSASLPRRMGNPRWSGSASGGGWRCRRSKRNISKIKKI